MTILKSKLDVLIAARELIADEGRWTQGAMARCDNDLETVIGCFDAYKFCSLGAIMHAGKSSVYTAQACNSLSLSLDIGSCITEYNDTHSHAEVLAVWDETIRRVAEEALK